MAAVTGLIQMSDTLQISDGLRQIENEMQSLLDRQTPPYDAAWNIYSKAMILVTASPDVMHPFWLIWGSLTDWVENRPGERKEAESKMRQAAFEWLELNREDAVSVKAYCDRWVFDEMGYAREKR
jgi:hypothetical protein